MEYFVKAFGIVAVALGAVCIVSPAFIRKMIELAKVGKRIYIGGGFRVVVGILLLVSVSVATVPAIPAIIGCIILVSGILIFALGPGKILPFMDWFYNLPDTKLRLLPIVHIVIGVLLIYSV